MKNPECSGPHVVLTHVHPFPSRPYYSWAVPNNEWGCGECREAVEICLNYPPLVSVLALACGQHVYITGVCSVSSSLPTPIISYLSGITLVNSLLEILSLYAEATKV